MVLSSGRQPLDRQSLGKPSLGKQSKPSFLITLGVCFSLAGLIHYGALQRLEYLGLDHLSRLVRQTSVLPDAVAVILIDEPALQYMDPSVGRWPWPREVYRDIIEYINLGRPKAIHFDILFSERQVPRSASTHEIVDGDKQLAAATITAGNVIHTIQLLYDEEFTTVNPTPLSAAITQHSITPTTVIPHPTVPLQQVFRDYLAPNDQG